MHRNERQGKFPQVKSSETKRYEYEVEVSSNHKTVKRRYAASP